MRQLAVLGLVLGLATAGCAGGHSRAGGTAGPDCVRPTPGGGPRVDGSIGLADNGRAVCLAKGATLAVYLNGTAASRWAPVQASGDALSPRPNGAGSLMVGVTGAFYEATKPGSVRLASARPPCTLSTRGCDRDHYWTVTVVIQ